MRLVILLALVLTLTLPLAATAQGAQRTGFPNGFDRYDVPATSTTSKLSVLFESWTASTRYHRRTPSRSSSPSQTRSTRTTTATSV